MQVMLYLATAQRFRKLGEQPREPHQGGDFIAAPLAWRGRFTADRPAQLTADEDPHVQHGVNIIFAKVRA